MDMLKSRDYTMSYIRLTLESLSYLCLLENGALSIELRFWRKSDQCVLIISQIAPVVSLKHRRLILAAYSFLYTSPLRLKYDSSNFED